MSKTVKRLLGMSEDGKPIFAPKHSHSLLLSAAGGGKTTCGAMPWLLSLLPDVKRAIVVNDCKDGEIAAQAAELCHRYGRKVAIIDDFGVLGEDNPFRVSLSPFGSLRSAHEQQNGELVFATENANHALIPEPPNDGKNQYFRDEPRTLIEFCERELLENGSSIAVPGAVWSMLSDTNLLTSAARIAVEDGDAMRKSLGEHVLDMQENDKEHWSQHRAAALKALRIYGGGSPLHRAGRDAELTHEDLLAGRYVVFLVGPQRHMARLGAHYALHLQSFVDVVLTWVSISRSISSWMKLPTHRSNP